MRIKKKRQLKQFLNAVFDYQKIKFKLSLLQIL